MKSIKYSPKSAQAIGAIFSIALVLGAFAVLWLKSRPATNSNTNLNVNIIDPKILNSSIFNDMNAKDTNGLPIELQPDDKAVDNPFDNF